MWSRPQYHMSGPETPLATTSDVSCPGGEQGEQTLSQTGAPGAARRCALALMRALGVCGAAASV